jgi:hypothetical protein
MTRRQEAAHGNPPSTADQYRVDRFGRKERGDARKCDRLVLTRNGRWRTAAIGQ